jgi:hypothetical protein
MGACGVVQRDRRERAKGKEGDDERKGGCWPTAPFVKDKRVPVRHVVPESFRM